MLVEVGEGLLRLCPKMIAAFANVEVNGWKRRIGLEGHEDITVTAGDPRCLNTVFFSPSYKPSHASPSFRDSAFQS